MDQGEQEREIHQKDFVFRENVPKDPLNQALAFYEVLRSLGFRIVFQEGATDPIDRQPLENSLRVLVHQESWEKIDQVESLLANLPEDILFLSVSHGGQTWSKRN